MNEIANNPLEKRNEEHYENLKVAKTWMTGTMDKKELKPLWLKQDERGRIWAALRLNMEGIDHELEKMGWYLMKSTTHYLRNYWKNGTMGKKDFRQHSGWKERQNLIRWKNLNENTTLRLNG